MYEDNLEDLEDELLNNNLEDFNRTILAIRKELSVLSSYYEQLSDMGETLKQNAAEQGAEKEEFIIFLLCERRDGFIRLSRN